MEPSALWVRVGIQKGQYSVPAIGHMEDQEIQRKQRADKCVCQIFELQASHEEDANRNRGAGDRGTEVRLKDDEPDKDQCGQDGRKQSVAPVVHRLRAVLQEKCKEENQHWLCQLGRLKREPTKMEPTMGMMSAVEEENRNQHQRGQTQQRKNYCRML